MKNSIFTIILIFLVATVVISFSALFTVDVTEQAMIIQMGKPVKVIKEPGLHVKIPFIQAVTKFSKKLLEYDANPSEIITKDKKILVIDNYCRWKIEDPLKFYLNVRDVPGALARLDDIIYSEMRIELAQHTLIEVVSVNRNQVMHNVTELSGKKAKEYGIYIEDVRIKRADLPPENEQKVYDRMKAERNRIAKQYRSEGMEESEIIKSRADKESRIIIAEAYRKVQEIKGKADAEVVKITAKAYNKDINFYEFTKSLEVYNKVIKEDSDLFMSTAGKLFQFLFSN